jgi:hypothetical protein
MPPLKVAAGGELPTMGAGAEGATVVPPGKYPPPAELDVLGVNWTVAVLGVSGNRLGNCTRCARKGCATRTRSAAIAPMTRAGIEWMRREPNGP